MEPSSRPSFPGTSTPREQIDRMSFDFLNFNEFFRALRTYNPLQVTIELLLIGLFVHWVLRFLRGTRGARLLKGIAFVLISLFLIIQLLAAQFQLERIRFLYTQFLTFASYAIVVV